MMDGMAHPELRRQRALRREATILSLFFFSFKHEASIGLKANELYNAKFDYCYNQQLKRLQAQPAEVIIHWGSDKRWDFDLLVRFGLNRVRNLSASRIITG